MKKILALIGMIACLTCLTACTSTELSDHDNMKLDVAQQITPQILSVVQQFMDETSITLLQQYTAEEVAHTLEYSYNMPVDGYAFLSGLESFYEGSKEIGDIVSFGDTTSVIDGHQIIVTIEVLGDRKNAEAELVFSNDLFLRVESISLNPQYTFGQIMGRAGINTLLGMGTVFLVLALIIVVITLLGFVPRLFNRSSKKETLEEARAEGMQNAVSHIEEQEKTVGARLTGGDAGASDEDILGSSDENSLELVAVIAAAVAASQGSGTTEGFVVRSIRRIRRNK